MNMRQGRRLFLMYFCALCLALANIIIAITTTKNQQHLHNQDHQHRPPRLWGRLLTNPNTTQAFIDSGDPIHFFTVLSGCRIARRVFFSKELPRRHTKRVNVLDDCAAVSHNEQQLHLSSSAAKVFSNYDTVYVTHIQLEEFVEWLWNQTNFEAKIVVLSGQWQKTSPHNSSTVDRLLQHPNVLKWFCQNLPTSVDLSYLIGSKQHTHKIASFPYGLLEKYVRKKPHKRFVSYGLDEYRDAFVQNSQTKTNLVYAGFLSPSLSRKHVPSGPPLETRQFYQEILASHYVLSPDGDRPECYRHYEALGLGTVPLTQLSRRHYSHLEDSVIYNNTEWNLTLLNNQLPQPSLVNRNVVLEEYWMEYVNWISGHSLKWWSMDQERNIFLEQVLPNLN